MPDLEVHGLAGSDAEQDAQHLKIGHLLSEAGVQAGAALLDESEVESGGVGNGLKMVGDGAVRIQLQVIVIQRNCRVRMRGEIRDSIFKSSAEVGILDRAPVARPPRGVYLELLQIRQAAGLRHAGDLAGWKNSEMAEIDGVCSERGDVMIEKGMVADFIVGVVHDVLGHVAIEHLERSHIIRCEASADFSAVLHEVNRGESLVGRAAEFGVLNPQVGLDLFEGAEEAKNSDVAPCDRETAGLLCKDRIWVGQHSRAQRCSACSDSTSLQE